MCLFSLMNGYGKRDGFFSPLILNLVAQIEKLTVGIQAFSFSLSQVMTEQPHGKPEKGYSKFSLFSQNDCEWNGHIRKFVQQLHHEKDWDTYWSKNVIGKM